VTLAAHEASGILDNEISPFQYPLPDPQWLSCYGRVESTSAHMRALQKLVNLRGGLEALGEGPLSWAIIQ
jgi:hypothetical protein